ncbi:MAG TPA: 2-C-methyl-D-erythritol 4-phosphate cytidylyltransferase [Gemmatimonadales bacterium]|nr:2-C-methyl-D-erythritol 4-phosphate cytidylyltransferase [Gemmatimonadales bacterium]
MPRDVGVVVVAAGSGSRIGGAPKQFRPIAGVPMVLRAIRPFAAHPEVAHLVLVLPPADAANPPAFLCAAMGSGLTLAAGGAERSDSVASGLAALRPDCRIVLVHDAARPFVESATIDAVIRQARRGAGAIAAVAVTDTVKEVAPDGSIVRTVPRERLWRAHTPQGFPREMLERAHAEARTHGIAATDDAMLVERLGAPVYVVPDSPHNRKVTTAEDLAWAELWAARG